MMRLGNLRIKTLGAAISALLVVVAVAVVATSYLTVKQVDRIGDTWADFETGAAAKTEILSSLRGALGYGGVIHHFKNFVLRKDRPRLILIQEKLFDISVALTAYQHLGTSERERDALAQFNRTLSKYARAVAVVERMAAAGVSSREIDEAVKIDDRPALEALAVLHDVLYQERHASAESVYRSVALVKDLAPTGVLVISGLLGFLVVSFLWFTRSRLVLPLAALGNAMHDLAHGDTTIDVPAIDRNDELGAMAKTVQVFKENAILRDQAEFELRESKQRLEAQSRELEDLGYSLLDARDSADEANRAKSEFLALMSHELRTPLNAVIGFSEAIEMEAFGPVGSDKYLEYARDIAMSGQHLHDLINDILDLSKVEAGMQELHEEIFEVSGVIETVMTLVRGRADADGVDLVLDTQPNLPTLHADMRKLKQILVNLLSNAIKFTDTGGSVTLKTWCRRDSGYVFQVSDTGIGMAVDDIPKALRAFGQVESAVSRKYEGTGLGLPLTKALVELHGGSLDLQSEIGVGTTVTVRLPTARIAPLPQDTYSATPIIAG